MRYRVFDVNASPLGSGRILLHSKRSGVTKALSLPDAKKLLACQTFNTLQDHALTYAQQTSSIKLRNRSKSETLRGRLQDWMVSFQLRSAAGSERIGKASQSIQLELAALAEEGFLISEEELLADICTSAHRSNGRGASPRRITSIGIPTRGRPDSLKRAMTSYAANCRANGREVKFVIADDSRRPSVQEENRKVLYRRKKEGTDVRYLGRDQRVEYARALADRADVPFEVAKFGLLGDDRCKGTCGAARNALLLYTAGEMCLQVDDDTVASVAPAPRYEEKLVLTSRSGLHELWFFEAIEAAKKAVSFSEEDVCGLHEQLLGMSLSDRLITARTRDEAICIDEVSPRFVKNVQRHGAGVAVSFIGTLGDSGSESNGHIIFAEGESYRRLTRTKKDYQSGIRTRQIIKAPVSPTISDGRYCMTTNIGLDNRVLLPPFMPVQRNGDGVFGNVLRMCFHQAYSGHVPFVVLHDPLEQRAALTESVSLRTNDILIRLLGASEAQWSRVSEVANLQAVGRFLTDVASLSASDFEDVIWTVVTHSVGARIRHAEKRLGKAHGRPAYWAKDVQRHIASVEEAVTQSSFFAPSDLQGSVEERRALFQELVGAYGRLLVYWPAMVEAAKALRAERRERTVRL